MLFNKKMYIYIQIHNFTIHPGFGPSSCIDTVTDPFALALSVRLSSAQVCPFVQLVFIKLYLFIKSNSCFNTLVLASPEWGRTAKAELNSPDGLPLPKPDGMIGGLTDSGDGPGSPSDPTLSLRARLRSIFSGNDTAAGFDCDCSVCDWDFFSRLCTICPTFLVRFGPSFGKTFVTSIPCTMFSSGW